MEAIKEQEIVRMASMGFTPIQIAGELEISVTSVRSILKVHGKGELEVEASTPHGKDVKIIAAYQSDVPVPQILQDFGISYGKLYTLLSKTNTPLRKKALQDGNALALEQAVEMYVAGAPLWKIKEETSVPQPKLHDALHTRNIPLRRPRK